MKMEKSQQTTQKYKGSLETTLSYYLGKLEEMDKFLEKFNLPKLNQEDTENLNRHTTSTELETLIRNFPTNKHPGPDGLAGEFYQKLREGLTPILLKLFQKFAEECNLPNSFYKATIIQIQKSKL